MNDERDSLVWSARKDGRELVVLEQLDGVDSVVVECRVYPVGSASLEPLQPGPYAFATPAEASAFVQETLRALMYLACDVDDA